MTNETQFVFAVDIGNTRTSIALIDCSTYTCIKKTALPSNNVIELINTIFLELTLSLELPCSVKISSVIIDLAEQTSSILSKLDKVYNISIINHAGLLPFKIDYDNPQNLGSDRIADALYASHFYPDKNVIIVDAGTAVTVDFLSKDKIFKGGVIFPGLKLQLESLALKTSQLPHLKSERISEFKIPNSTFDAINIGTLFSIAGGIEKSIENIKSRFQDVTIICTGGNWDMIKNQINHNVSHIEDLTLLGISLFEK